ncbi:hypothetical protein EB169_02005 [archaeon]|nr:hypothetical protein [archaeon]
MAKKSTKKNIPVNVKKLESKKSELDNINLADGKVHVDPDIEKVKQLEEILGIRKSNPFGTSNIDIFREKLSEMTIVDMQHMCEKIGIFASGSRQQIKEKLLREFKSTNKGTISMLVNNPSLILDPNNPDHKETIKILREL